MMSGRVSNRIFFFIGANSDFPEVEEGGAKLEKKIAVQWVDILYVTSNVHFRIFLCYFHFNTEHQPL